MNGPPTRSLHPKIKLVWLAAALLPVALLAVLLTLLAIVGSLPPWAAALIVVALLGPASWLPGAHYRRWRYEIRERDVYITKGLLVHSSIVMPFDRIQYVETKQGPLDRWFGLHQLVVRTAGGEVSIPGLRAEEAQQLRERLAAVVGSLSV